MHYSISQKVVLKRESCINRYIAYNALSWETYDLTGVQFDVLRSLSENGNDEDIIDKLTLSSKKNKQLSGYDFVEKGIIFECSDETKRVIRNVKISCENNKTHMSSPNRIEMCVTRRCNMFCLHCNMSAKNNNAKEETPISFWLDAVDKCVDYGVQCVLITGGEPLLRDDFNLLLAKLAESPISTKILTNGFYLNDFHVDLMKKANMSVSLSLDGITPDIHDSFRGCKGAYEKTIEAMRLLGAAGVFYGVTVTITGKNINDLERFFEVASSYKAHDITFGVIDAVGRAESEHAEEYFPEDDELEKMYRKFDALVEKYPNIKATIDTGRHTAKQVEKGTSKSFRKTGLCKAGLFSLAINEDGTVYPCLRAIQTYVNPMGKFSEKTFTDEWHSDCWNIFRDERLPRVPCRVEAIEGLNKSNLCCGKCV